MFFLGRNFVSILLCALKPKSLTTSPQKRRFFPARLVTLLALTDSVIV